MRTKNRRRRNRQLDYWVFAKPNQMTEHRFTDDVALCKAGSKSEALKKFKVLYENAEDKDVHRLNSWYHGWHGVKVLTDY